MILAIADCFSQEVKRSFGINIYGFLKGNISIHSGYAFAEHWSLSSDISVGYTRLTGSKEDIETIHDEEFSDGHPVISKPPDLIVEHISFRYWLRSAMRGAFIATGIRTGSSTGLDFTSGIGYAIPIWNGLKMTAVCTFALKNMLTEKETGLNGLDICICYTF